MLDDESVMSRADLMFGEAENAALIATFYGPSDKRSIKDLHQLLYEQLASDSSAFAAPDHWRYKPAEGYEEYGHCFYPPGRAATDTMAVQLALNAPDSADEAWKSMRQNLRDALYPDDQTLEASRNARAMLKHIWGYTLVYQAVLREGADPDRTLDTSIGSIGRLEPFDSAASHEGVGRLELADVPGGRVWLLGIPDRGGGWAACTVYCALGPPKGERALLDQFYGRAATLLTPDLIAHKGYYQMRQYRSEDLEQGYEDRLQDLRQTTEELLRGMERGKVESSTLNCLSKYYYRLVPMVSRFKELHNGVLKQLKNGDLWRERAVGNRVVDFHLDQLKGAAVELELMVQPLEEGLDTADKAVSLAQAQMTRNTEQEAERRHRDVTMLLILVEGTLVAATLALATVELTANWKEVSDHPKVAIGTAFIIIAILILGWRWIQRWRSLES